jgi:hypothetical protein
MTYYTSKHKTHLDQAVKILRMGEYTLQLPYAQGKTFLAPEWKKY